MIFLKQKLKNTKKYKKRSKSGKTRDATTLQFSISLNRDNSFQEEVFIYILTNNELKELKEQLDVYKNADISDKSDSNKLEIL